MRIALFLFIGLAAPLSAKAQSFEPSQWMHRCFAHFDQVEDAALAHLYETRCALYPAEMCYFVGNPSVCFASFKQTLDAEADRLLAELPVQIEGEGFVVEGLNDTLQRGRSNEYGEYCTERVKGVFENESLYMPNVIEFQEYCGLYTRAFRVNELRYVRGQLNLIGDSQ
ncbi:MAG: hypothetical protein AAGA08_05320 [Pseudomonadota bacterium]